jgi:hypothetical protein
MRRHRQDGDARKILARIVFFDEGVVIAAAMLLKWWLPRMVR